MSILGTTLSTLLLQSGVPVAEVRQSVIVPVVVTIPANSQERFRLRSLPVQVVQQNERPLRWESNTERFQISLAKISLRFIF